MEDTEIIYPFNTSKTVGQRRTTLRHTGPDGREGGGGGLGGGEL